MKQLSDYVIISDMDGTLLGPDSRIPPRNVQAIERFTALGGRFGIATGRSRGLMLDMAWQLPVNAPCVLFNGGALYDFAHDQMLMQRFLPPQAERYLSELLRDFSDVGLTVIGENDALSLAEERRLAEFVETGGEQYFVRNPIDAAPPPWYKAVFQVPSAERTRYLEEFSARGYQGVRFVGTAPTLAEMLPEDCTKGSALEELIRQGYVQRENLVAIGDFYNDLEMIEMAGIGVTLCTAPDDIQQKADLVVGDCAKGAVADIIEYLEACCTGREPAFRRKTPTAGRLLQ